MAVCLFYAFALAASCAISGAIFVSSQPRHTEIANTWPLPTLKQVEHSYLSTDARASASFILRYIANTTFVPDESFVSSNKVVSVIDHCAGFLYECSRMRFVEDRAATASKIAQLDLVRTVDEEWTRVGSAALKHEIDYSPWVDNHDGIGHIVFNADLAIKDGLLVQTYSNGPIRVPLPHTLFTIELMLKHDRHAHHQLIDYSGIPKEPEHCRHDKGFGEIGTRQNSWWKSTFAANDPRAAANFAVHALGAQLVTSPFRLEGDDCTVAEWVVLPDSNAGLTENQANTKIPPPTDNYPEGLMLHFVKNPGYPMKKMSPYDLADELKTLRALDSDIFDQHMYTHIHFEADSLDPFVSRFRELNLPFITRKSRTGSALYVSDPKNGLVFKISSSKYPLLVAVEKDDEASSP